MRDLHAAAEHGTARSARGKSRVRTKKFYQNPVQSVLCGEWTKKGGATDDATIEDSIRQGKEKSTVVGSYLRTQRFVEKARRIPDE